MKVALLYKFQGDAGIEYWRDFYRLLDVCTQPPNLPGVCSVQRHLLFLLPFIVDQVSISRLTFPWPGSRLHYPFGVPTKTFQISANGVARLICSCALDVILQP